MQLRFSGPQSPIGAYILQLNTPTDLAALCTPILCKGWSIHSDVLCPLCVAKLLLSPLVVSLLRFRASLSRATIRTCVVSARHLVVL